MIVVSELTKAYGQTLAVDRVSFQIEKGEVVGFLGPNGAGKSTTIKILTCYQPPTSGGATVNGFDIFKQSEQVRETLGYLPENTPLYPEMRVEEYLDFRGRLRKLDLDKSAPGRYLSAFTCGDQLLWGAAEPLRRMLRILLEG